ncbi:MAG: T9SS type A sorting domain-containing protein, partial [Ignavibacteriae bacterium]|nr:T9SS type A sorting domain-containing protein [Ignavibacteriota bacterium]
FNPITKIQFDISKSSNVVLKIFDITGKEINTLVNEKLNAGTYETQWNADNYPSEVYFYRLETTDYIVTKKMILIK